MAFWNRDRREVQEQLTALQAEYPNLGNLFGGGTNDVEFLIHEARKNGALGLLTEVSRGEARRVGYVLPDGSTKVWERQPNGSYIESHYSKQTSDQILGQATFHRFLTCNW